MLGTIAGYHLIEHLYESANSTIYRGRSPLTSQLAILKVLKQDYPTPAELTRYRQEYEITRGLKVEGVIQVYGLEPYERTLAILMEDIRGRSLQDWFGGQALPLDQFLPLAIRIVKILGQIHSHNVIHKDINPSNILLNRDQDLVRIIDFGSSTQLSRETPTLKHPQVLEGTLAYLSPEQTGRMNRVLDYRTDFYSLGVTFYELLTGQLPFVTTDVLALVHAHLAQQPVSPRQLNPAIPPVLAQLILMLMAKTAEQRYQSAFGIQADLETCWAQWQATGTIPPFVLGAQDQSDKFQIPQKLYGRAPEIATLLAAFGRVTGTGQTQSCGRPQGTSFKLSSADALKGQNSGRELVLVAGYSGVGKSSLVAEIYKPVTEKRGYFITGKYDQYQRDVPYSAVIRAFRNLAKQLLSESQAQLDQWRERLLTALGPNSQVMINVIPELELIIGPQPPVPTLGPTETQNRFNLVFQRFMQIVCAPNHPLVMFLDDLQWADAASLALMRRVMGDRALGSLLVIGAYRDNEVDATHPLMTWLNQLHQDNVATKTITLRSLSPQHLNQLIADTVNHRVEVTSTLADLVWQKTEGNPFFVAEFLKQLYADALLRFNVSSHQWEWDVEKIQAQDLTSNVVELLIDNLKQLPLATQEVLKLAACVGAQFDLNTLTIICEQSQSAIFHNLKTAMQLGLVLPLSELTADLLFETFRFGHDRIQQAAYALIEPERKAAVHLRIGRFLWHNLAPEARHERLFEVIDHLNHDLTLVTTPVEREQLAQLNLQGGQKAKSATAYQAALRYLNTGLDLLGPKGWHHCYDLTLKLHEEAIEAAYLDQAFEQQERLSEIVLEQAQTILDTVQTRRIMILACQSHRYPRDAIAIGTEILHRLGFQFPPPRRWRLWLERQWLRLLLAPRSIPSLIELPVMENPKHLAVLQVLEDIVSSGFQVSVQHTVLSILKQVALCLRHGNTAASAFTYEVYGLTLCGALGDIASGYQFGCLGLRVLEKFEAKNVKSRVLFVFNGFVRHWQEPLSNTIDDLHNAYHIGIETGDLEFGAYSLVWEATHRFLIGQELSDLADQLARFDQIMVNLSQSPSLLNLQIHQQVIAHLLDQVPNPYCSTGEFLAEETTIMERGDDQYHLGLFYTLKVLICYLLEDYASALDGIQRGTHYLENLMSSALVAVLNFYDSLTRLALYPTLPKVTQRQTWRIVRANQNQMRRWAQHAPQNFQHKYDLVEAECSRCRGQANQAGTYYDAAIALATAHHYPHEAALAHELAAKFYFSQQRDNLASVYLRDAYYGYYHWGATTKVKQLEQRYPQLLAAPMLGRSAHVESATDTPVITSIENSGDQTLDLTALRRASEAIASEIVLEQLLATLVQILIQSAGAQVGHLILAVEGELLIEASRDLVAETQSVLQSTPITGHLPQTLIDYVLRTQESVVLDDASCTGQFAQDPYIQARQPQSLLCAPLLNQGQLNGIFYLENNLTTGAFTPERLELLQLLSGQAAIAIDNALLYANLEQKVAERTQALTQALETLKTTQAELIQSEKMASLGQLVAGVAHEINTPVGNAMLTASVLQNETAAFEAALAQGTLKRSMLATYLETAADSSGLVLSNLKRAAELIQNFKQVAVDQASLEQRSFAAIPYLEQILTSLEPQLKPTTHQVKITGDAEITLLSYPGAFAQVVTNLVTNSLLHAYQPDASGQLCFDLQQQGDRLILSYSDDGGGIPVAHQAKIFEPFFTTARDHGGSGLGLHVVHNIVTQSLQGTIHCESEVGFGTTFILDLPLQVTDELAATHGSRAEPDE